MELAARHPTHGDTSKVDHSQRPTVSRDAASWVLPISHTCVPFGSRHRRHVATTPAPRAYPKIQAHWMAQPQRCLDTDIALPPLPFLGTLWIQRHQNSRVFYHAMYVVRCGFATLFMVSFVAFYASPRAHCRPRQSITATYRNMGLRQPLRFSTGRPLRSDNECPRWDRMTNTTTVGRKVWLHT